MPKTLYVLVLVMGALAGFGGGIRRSFRHRAGSGWTTAACGTAIAVAFGTSSLAVFLSNLLGFGRVVLVASVFVCMFFGLLFPIWAPLPAPCGPRAARPPGGWTVAQKGILGIVLVGCAYAFAAAGFFSFRTMPDGTHDAIALWNAKARILYYNGPRSGEVLRQQTPRTHPDYPLLLPGAIAAQQAVLGTVSNAVSRSVNVAYVVALILLVSGAVARLGAPEMVPIAAILLLTAPAVSASAFSQCADVVVAVYLLAAAHSLSVPFLPPAKERTGREAWIGGLLCGLLAWAKAEGLLLSLILLVTFATFQGRARAQLSTRAGLCLRVFGGAMPGFVSLGLFRFLWAPGLETGRYLNGLVAKLTAPERWWVVTKSFLGRLVPISQDASNWSFHWALIFAAGLALVVGPGRRLGREVLYLWSLLLMSLAAYACTYVLTPHDVAWHLDTSLDRLLVQVYPLSVVALAASVGAYFRSGPGEEASGESESGPQIPRSPLVRAPQTTEE